MRSPAFLLLLLGAAACASAAPSPAPGPDRVLVVDTDGSVVHQSTLDENARATFAAPKARVWRALVNAYTTLAILPTANDPTTGQYGNAGFLVPRRIVGRPISEFFSCGTSMTGPRIDNGRVYGYVMSVVSDNGAGGSTVITHVSATLRPNDGTSTEPSQCASTGALEELLRKNIQQSLSSP